MNILAIETSCDETAASIIQIKKNNVTVLSHIVYSQINEHKKFGGVVPEVAARLHSVKIIPVIDECLKKASLSSKDISFIAVTSGPGLATSLLVGIQTAQTLGYLWKKKVIPTNHIFGHLLSPLLNKNTTINNLTFPALALIVSGGHTDLVLLQTLTDITIVGTTRDDAVGESFDKVAKLLNLGYPGGPLVSQLATEATTEVIFPRPMIDSPNLDFSFSGLKTAVRYETEKSKSLTKKQKSAICKGFENAVVDVLLHKTLKAIKKYSITCIILGGGVAANQTLRGKLKKDVKAYDKTIKLLIPEKKYCTDNASMIALAGYFSRENACSSLTPIEPNPQWKVGKKK